MVIDQTARTLEWIEGPPGRYESTDTPHLVMGFADDGTGVYTEDNNGQAISWSQP